MFPLHNFQYPAINRHILRSNLQHTNQKEHAILEDIPSNPQQKDSVLTACKDRQVVKPGMVCHWVNRNQCGNAHAQSSTSHWMIFAYPTASYQGFTVYHVITYKLINKPMHFCFFAWATVLSMAFYPNSCGSLFAASYPIRFLFWLHPPWLLVSTPQRTANSLFRTKMWLNHRFCWHNSFQPAYH